ncbi:glutamine synthetase family protein [Saccharicrinis sp. FJH2]|uniref:glutamine synthetase family protein n=1 Tax=Saccharicrinis sp. FJH65 TaxID=3344659 RepID=UPI0035F2308D
MDKEKIIQSITDSKESKVKIAVADIDGVLRGKYIHKHKFLDSLDKTIGLCDVIFGWDSGDVCYDNSEVTGWHSGYPDAKAKIDITTFRQIPWEGSTPFFLADFSQCKKYAESTCPRSLLKRVNEECESMGFKAMFAQEFEWFNFKGKPDEMPQSGFQQPEPVTPGMFGYSVLRTSLNQAYCNDIFEMMEAFNVPLEGIHTETGPGVYEAAILYDDVISAADKAVLFKSGVREIAYQHNMMASFMAKWNIHLPGSGGHIHQSLWDKKGETNLFFDEKGSNGMSDIMEHYIAGQLTCLPEILPMFAPTVNSYKRISHGDWAPSTVTWGIDNRTTAVRVIPLNKTNTRIESRVPGADTNPYLAIAAALASGLYGIKHQLKLSIPQSIGNAYQDKNREELPDSLLKATEKMATSKIAKGLFGDAFVNHFTKTREWEWRQFMNQVTDWELKRYFEII